MNFRAFGGFLLVFAVLALLASGVMYAQREEARGELALARLKALAKDANPSWSDVSASGRAAAERITELTKWIERTGIGGGVGLLLGIAIFASAKREESKDDSQRQEL